MDMVRYGECKHSMYRADIKQTSSA
jgi:hypothetical protein